MKKRVAIFFSFLLIALVPALNVYAIDPAYSYIEYEDGTISIIKQDSLTTEVHNPVLPSEIDGKKVTEIANDAFDYTDYQIGPLTGTLTLPEGITRIGLCSFRGQKISGNLVIPASVKTIEYTSFSDCSSLDGNLVFLGKVTEIEHDAFNSCAFTGDLILPDSVTLISDNAFEGCKFDGTLDIPASLQTLGNYAFYRCYSVKKIINRSKIIIPASSFLEDDQYCFIDDSGNMYNLNDDLGEGTYTRIRSVTNLSLNKAIASVEAGKSLTLKPTVSPSDAHDKGVIWSSSDESVASVNSSGVVTGITEGSATIIATAKTNLNVSASCKITVTPAKDTTVRVTKVKLNKTKATLVKGQKLTLKPTISPSKATNKKLTWSSSNKKVAKVDAKGVVTAIGKGTATITVKTKDGGKKATCKITVNNPPKVKSLTFSKTKVAVKKGKKKALKLTAAPKNSIYNEFVWTSSNKRIATVDKSGNVKGIKKGTVTITVKTKDGKVKTSCKVTVN